MAKRLTEAEKQLRFWQKDRTLRFVLKCKKCGYKHLVGDIESNRWCKCGNVIYKNRNPFVRNCTIIYTREN